MALSAARNTPRRGSSLHSVSVYVKDGYTIYEGSIVCLDGVDGYAVPGRTATGLVAVGVFAPKAGSVLHQGAISEAVADGNTRISCDCGIFDFDNYGSDPVVQASIGATCYIYDDHTVCVTGSGKSAAGKVMFLNGDDSVSVLIGLPGGYVD